MSAGRLDGAGSPRPDGSSFRSGAGDGEAVGLGAGFDDVGAEGGAVKGLSQPEKDSFPSRRFSAARKPELPYDQAWHDELGVDTDG